MLSQKLTNLQL